MRSAATRSTRVSSRRLGYQDSPVARDKNARNHDVVEKEVSDDHSDDDDNDDDESYDDASSGSSDSDLGTGRKGQRRGHESRRRQHVAGHPHSRGRSRSRSHSSRHCDVDGRHGSSGGHVHGATGRMPGHMPHHATRGEVEDVRDHVAATRRTSGGERREHEAVPVKCTDPREQQRQRQRAIRALANKLFQPGALIDHLEIVRKLGSGSFGDVFAAFDRRTGGEVAIKIEAATAGNPQILYEGRVLDVFQGQIGFPIKYFSGEWNGWNLLIMQLLGSSVEATRHMYEGGIMPLPVLHHVAQQGLARLRTMHLAGFVHRDVKPENFVFAATSDAYTCFGGGTGASVGVGHGHGGSVSSDGTWPLRASTSASAAPGPVDPKLLPLLHIIDFGFAKRVIDPATGQHIPKLTNQKFIGTPRFASVRAHEGILQSRRDDIEALGYMLVYLAKGRLPWQSGGAKTTYRPRQHGPAGARKYMDHGRPLDSIAEYAREDGGEAGARDRYRAANVPAHAPVEQQARGRVKVAESHAAPVVTAAAPASHITTADIRRQSMRKMFGAARAPGIPHAALTREEQRSKTKSSLARPTQPLPRGRTSKSRTERLRRHIYMKKRELSLHELCAGLPSCFMLMIDHARRLPFDAMPDYAYLDDLWSGRVV